MNVGGHAGHQLQLRIVGGDDDDVGGHVLHHLGRQAHLPDTALELPVGERIHGKGDALTFAHAADIGLVDIHQHLHLAQILGDGEQLGRLEARRHGLAGIDRTLHDHARNG